MRRSEKFSERIGAVFLPEADAVDLGEVPSLDPQVPLAQPTLAPEPEAPPGPGVPIPPFKRCSVTLKQGCYTLSFNPAGVSIFGTRYRGTLRVENVGTGVRISGDLYAYRLIGPHPPGPIHPFNSLAERTELSDEAADTGGTIPIYRRRDYHSYLKGTGAQLRSFVPRNFPCPFTLDFDEFVYSQPASGFSGSFNSAPDRSIRFSLSQTPTPDLYIGNAFQGATNLGLVSLRWISDSYRRARVEIHTLQGAVTPPADVGGTTMASIFTDVGWDVGVTDGGSISLPAALSGVNVSDCWSEANLHTLMASVPGYNPPELDSAWKLHLVAVPAKLGCGRGIMFDSSGGADPNNVPREGSGTFSHDGYPASEVPDGMGGSHYDGAANGLQKDFPRAFLRSATHEVGHAFNQIHQGFELGNDNSIMTPTPGVATVLGLAGTFPDDINLAFNDTVKKHLRHLPDPAVRPGAMDFFGSAIAAPQPADVGWLETLDLSAEPSADRVALGQPITLSWTLTNQGDTAVAAPAELDVETLVARVSVTDPLGNVTFMRPPRIKSCPHIEIVALEPGSSVDGSTTVFWGTDGFAFEMPGRHLLEVIVLWDLGGAPVAVSGETHVFVVYPTTGNENEVAALLLHPDVGRAVALGDVSPFEVAAERIRRANALSKSHPATAALRGLGLTTRPRRSRSRSRR